MPADTDELEVLFRAGAMNLDRCDLDMAGVIRFVLALHRHKVPVSQIASTIHKSRDTVDRILDVATNPDAWALVDGHCIQFSTLASLMKDARKANMAKELIAAIKAEASKIRQKLADENRSRETTGDKPRTGEKLWPQKYLSKRQIVAWSNALKEKKQLGGKPVIPFCAAVRKDENGTNKLVITGLSDDLNKLSYADLATICQRTHVLLSELGPHLERKEREERLRTQGTDFDASAALAKANDLRGNSGLRTIFSARFSPNSARRMGRKTPTSARQPNATNRTSRTTSCVISPRMPASTRKRWTTSNVA